MWTFSFRRVFLYTVFFVVCALGALHWGGHLDVGSILFPRQPVVDSGYRFAEPQRTALPPTPEPPVESVQSPTRVRHQAPPQFTCSRPETASLKETKTSVVVQSRDAAGRLVFSDRAQANATVESKKEYTSVERIPFDVNIREVGEPLPPLVQYRLREDANKVHRLFNDLLGEERMARVNLNVVIFDRLDDFIGYRTKVAPLANTESGFYDHRTTTAAVMHYGDHERTRRVVRHETTHLLLHAIVGRVPVWLNEGLAEYVENGPVSIAPGPIDEDRLRSLTRWTFYAGESGKNYQAARAYVTRIMKTPHKRRELAEYLVRAAQEPCVELPY